MSGDENLSAEFLEAIQNTTTLSQDAINAIRIISKGGTPSGKQVARPDLMIIIKFLLETHKCIKPVEIVEVTETQEEEKPFKCPKCDKRFSSKEDGCKHAETIIDLGMDCFSSNAPQAETFSCSKCDKKFSNAEDLKKHETTHAEVCHKYKIGACIFGSRGKNQEGQCPKDHPRKCAKFLNDIKGCTTKDCTYLHPTVCKFVRNGRPCLVAGCTLAHPVAKSKLSGAKENPSAAKDVTNGSQRDGTRKPFPPARDGNGNIQAAKGGNPTPPNPKKQGSFLGQEVILKMMDTMKMMETNLTSTIQSVTERLSALEERQARRTTFGQRNTNSWWRN